LNVGAIVAASPVIGEELKKEFRQWGPGKYDPRHHAFDGTALRILNSPSLPIVIPPVYGLRGVGFETFTGDGPISYWNAYVGIGQMGGKGDFRDDRIGLVIDQPQDLVTPKLPALLDYQLTLRAPVPARGSLDEAAVARGRRLFRTEARCATCHQGPTYTDVLSSPRSTRPFLHAPAEVGQDPAYALRSATRMYRTTPLRGLLQHPPYFHDGRAATLTDVVNHYDRLFGLGLSAREKADLVEFLKSL
jgi:mono/diheme cytochrome c family protein